MASVTLIQKRGPVSWRRRGKTTSWRCRPGRGRDEETQATTPGWSGRRAGVFTTTRGAIGFRARQPSRARYLLTDPRQLDILQSGPGWRESNAIRPIETPRVYYAVRRRGGVPL